jgi:hypothetical protein
MSSPLMLMAEFNIIPEADMRPDRVAIVEVRIGRLIECFLPNAPSLETGLDMWNGYCIAHMRKGIFSWHRIESNWIAVQGYLPPVHWN